MPTLSLCMIVKNEASVLARCLESVRTLVDEMIIVDTGSEDDTVAIASSFGARVLYFTWMEDFAAARNASFAAATGDYILWLDADDVLLPQDLEQLLALKPRLDKDIYYLHYNYSQDAQGRSLCTLRRERMVRRTPTGHWHYPIHEVYGDSGATTREWLDITVTHQRTGTDREEGRNLRIFQKAMKEEAYRNDPRMLYYYGRELHDAGQHGKAITAFRRFLLDETGWSDDRYNARIRLAECLLLKNEQVKKESLFAEARRQAVLALRQEPARVEAKFILGNIAFKQELYTEAIHWYEQCLVPIPNTGGVINTYYYGLGPLLQLMFCHDRSGNFARAQEYNEQVLQLRPGAPGLLNNRTYFRDRTAGTTLPGSPLLDIIIPTLSNWPYLQATLESLEACTGLTYRVIVINSGNSPVPAALPGKPLVISSGKPLYFAQAINLGLAHSSADFICLLNDDVIVTRNWLPPLLEQAKQKNCLVHPLSNNNSGWLHHYDLRVGKASINDQCRLEDGMLVSSKGERLPPDDLYDAALARDKVFPVPWAPFFCILFSKKLVGKIGLLDEKFINACDDMNYCQRAAAAGCETVVNENSFVFHFGSVTLQQLQSRYPGEFKAIDEYNHSRAASSGRLIVIRAGHTFHPWHPLDRITKGLGGAETAVAALATALQARGNRVLVFSYFGANEGTIDGVEYWDDHRYEEFAARYSADIFIACRHASMLHKPVMAQQTYLWLHDLIAVDTELGVNDILRHYVQTSLTSIICLSPWHQRYASEAHGIDLQNITIIGNGIDEKLFEVQPPRNRKKLIYTSCPSRGLDIAVDIFAELRQRHPDASFDIYGSFTNWEDRAQARNNKEELEKINRLKYRLQTEEGVHFHGPVGQGQLAQACMSAGIWFYPCTVPETYCIAALEAQAGGLYCIASAAGALPTTLSNHANIIYEQLASAAFKAQALEHLEKLFLVQDDSAVREAIRAQALLQTWMARAGEWEVLFRDNEASARIARHQLPVLEAH